MSESRLELVISSQQAERSLNRMERNLNDVDRAGDRAQGSMREMSGSLDSVHRVAVLASGALAGFGLAQFSRNAFGAISSAQNLQASLKTVTGSADAAAKAWESLLGFASETPFTLEQSVQGFIRMKSLGLDPTNEALRSFGNTASAMGMDLMQMVEAVADAATGEFERLKEFGIQASKEGEQITFTFQGVETTVRNSSEAINQYLQNIGTTEFAGAMAEKVQTLGGQMSNLQDSVFKLYLAIGDAGATDAFGESIERAADAVESLTEAIENGALTGFIETLSDANDEGKAFIDEIMGIIDQGTEMKNALTAGFLEIEAGFYDMSASGVEAFASIASGATSTINQGLIPLQRTLNALDRTFAGIVARIADSLESAGELPAGMGNLFGTHVDRLRSMADSLTEGLIEPVGIATDALKVNSQALREQADAARQSAEAIRLGGDSAGGASGEFKTLDEWLLKLSKGAKDSDEQIKKLASGTADTAEKTYTLADAYDSLLDRISPNRREAKQYAKDLGLLNLALASGRMNTQQYMQAMGMLQESFQDAQRDTVDAVDAESDRMATLWERQLERMDDAGVDMWRSFLDGSEGAFDSFKNLALDTLAEVIHAYTTRQITASLGFNVGGIGGQSRGGMSAGSFDIGSLGSLKNGWDTVSGFFGGGSAASTAAGYGAAGWAGSATGAYGGWAGSAAAGAASTSGGLMGAASAAMPWVAGGMLVDEVLGLGIVDGIVSGISGLFGSSPTPFSGRFGTTSSLDRSEGAGKDGVFEHQGGGRFYGQSALGYVGFRDRGTERLQRAGTGSQDWAEELTNAAVEMDNLVASLASSPRELRAMQSAVQGLETSSNSAADIIDFALKTRPRAAIEAMSGDFGTFVKTLSGGIEDVVQQAQAAQQAYATVTDGLDRINVEFGVTGPAAYSAASEIAEFSGGLEQFSQQAQFYYENFITEAEKQERAMDAAAQAMGVFTARTGRVVTSADQLTDLVDGLNLNTVAGRELYAAAMELAPALLEVEAGLERVRARFSEMLSEAESAAASAQQQVGSAWQTFDRQSYDLQMDLLGMLGDQEAALALERERELATIDESLRPMQERYWAIQDEAQAVNDYASALENANTWLSSTLDNIAGWVDERRATSGVPSENLQETQSQFARQLTLAEAGDRDALQSITEYADRYLASASEYYASGDGYQSVESDVMDAISALPDVLSPEDYIAQDIKDALEKSENLSSLPDLKALAGEQLGQLNSLIAEMRNSTDQFVSLDSNMISLRDSINALGVAREEVARIERERAAAEKAERERVERERREGEYEQERQSLLDIQSELLRKIAATEDSPALARWKEQVAELNQSSGTRSAVEAAFENAASHLDFTAPADQFHKQLNSIIADFEAEGSIASARAYDPVAQILRAESLIENREQILADIERQIAQLKRPDGSHADGNWNVAFDGYLAELHKGEMVVPAEQANQLRGMSSRRAMPMPDMPLPQFPALGNSDVVEVLQDVKRELQESRKREEAAHAENARLLKALGGSVEKHGSTAEQQRKAQLNEQRAATRAARVKGRTV